MILPSRNLGPRRLKRHGAADGRLRNLNRFRQSPVTIEAAQQAVSAIVDSHYP